MLKTNLVTGITGDENDLIKRRNAFGTNRYPQKKGRSFLVCYFDFFFLFLSFQN